MGRAAENLQCQCRIHTACSLFQEADVLVFGLTNSSERGPKTHANPVLRMFLRVWDAGVIQGHFGGGDSELGITIKTLEAMGREELGRLPAGNFATAMGVEHRRIKS